MTFEDNHAGRDLARERLDGWKAEWERRIDAEQKLIALQDEVNELWPYRKRAEKAEEERDEARRHECSDLDAHWRLDETLASLKEANATVASLRAEQPRPLTADDIEQLVTQNRYRVADAIRALYPEEPMATDVLAHAVMTALTEPTRPEEKVEAVLHQYWSGDINGDDLADRIVEEMNR